MKEAVWRTYNKVYVLGNERKMRAIDLGRHNSSSADDLYEFIVRELHRYDKIVDAVSPTFLVRIWPPAFVEWSPGNVRDAFFAAAQFPCVL